MQQKRGILLLITGLPGSGKSTLARAFAARYGGVHIGSDQVREKLGLKGHYLPDDKKRIYAAMLARARAVVSEGGTAIVESTFYRKNIRRPFEQMAESLGIEVKWVEVSAAESAIRQRLQAPRPDSEADFEIYQKIRNEYEALDVPHLTLQSDKSPLDKLLEAIHRYLLSNHDD